MNKHDSPISRILTKRVRRNPVGEWPMPLLFHNLFLPKIFNTSLDYKSRSMGLIPKIGRQCEIDLLVVIHGTGSSPKLRW